MGGFPEARYGPLLFLFLGHGVLQLSFPPGVLVEASSPEFDDLFRDLPAGQCGDVV